MSRVFISYAWEDDVKSWVKEFADRLKSDGVDVHFDQGDLKLGDRLPKYMEEQITLADHVLIICTPTYKRKANRRTGGVGYEGHIISAEMINFSNERKFIPITRKGTFKSAIPTFLAGKFGTDLSADNNQYETNYQNLLTTILGKNHKSATHIELASDIDETAAFSEENEPIRILGIIKEQVTMPTMDGTPGCALYKVPFRLSRKPSDSWKEFFLQSWRMPSCFTSMHRSNIASIYEDEIILDGTTIEEVRDYHGKTLNLCVEEANEREQAYLEKQQQLSELKEQKRKQHFSNVAKIADDIQF